MGKIYIGEQNKKQIVEDYLLENNIQKIYVIGEPLDFELPIENEFIKFSECVLYKYFYHLLQEINKNSLVILNECLRKINRYDLTYNCIRRYVIQTDHRLIFNYFPIINNQEDFMILYDMTQNNPFLKESYKYVTKFTNIIIGKVNFNVNKREIVIDEEYVKEYEKEKESIIKQVKKDADIIPRRLLKYSESINKKYVGKFDSMKKIKKEMNVVVNQLKVDKYYYGQLMNFKEELNNVLERIQGR